MDEIEHHAGDDCVPEHKPIPEAKGMRHNHDEESSPFMEDCPACIVIEARHTREMSCCKGEIENIEDANTRAHYNALHDMLAVSFEEMARLRDALLMIGGSVDSCGCSHGSTFCDTLKMGKLIDEVIAGKDPHQVLKEWRE